ncbi:MAG TPA: Gldg family protein [Oscillospiraceae bacterium]|nr:Gldg family protein [Oscillospiraceae bacterium]HPK34942.1 Gldg family protein [Oscillospiraceae bacterium]HPR75349.1 Gldg family protein [Oscillospiraceae bacterium]
MKTTEKTPVQKTARVHKESSTGKTHVWITVVVSIVLLVTIFLAQSALDLLSLKADMTAQKIFTMSDETKAFVQSINKTVDIVVLQNENSFKADFPQQLEIIQSYAQVNPDYFTYSYVDVVYNPTYLLPYQDEQISEGDILVKCGERYKIVSYSDLDYTTTDTTTYESKEYSDVENAMNYAIQYVLMDKTYVIGFTTGHNEAITGDFGTFLEDNLFEVRSINLAGNPDLSDVSVIVAQGPQYDFSDEELKILDKFLTNDGEYDRTFAYFATLDKQTTPNLDAFLAEWGLVVTDDVVYELDSDRYMSNPLMVYAQVPESETTYGENYASLTPGTNYKLLMPYTRDIEFTFTAPAKGAITTTSLLESTGNPFLTTVDNAKEASFVPREDDPGDTSYTVAAISTKTVGAVSSRVWVSGSVISASDTFINDSTLINAKYLLESFKQWTERVVNEVVIDPINLTTETYSVSGFGETVVIFLIIVVLPPVAIIIAGLTVYSRRRHL